MIIQGLFNPIIDLISHMIGFLPDINIEVPVGSSVWTNVIRHSAFFFPMDWLSILILNFIAWWGVFITWAVIEWIYKKIPGVS